jgi:glucuronokinase
MVDKKKKIIKHRAYARVGFLGNPSDGYYGKTISFSLANFCATVWLEPSRTLQFKPHAQHNPTEFGSVQQLLNRIRGEGYYGGLRLLAAACKVFHEYFETLGYTLHKNNFTLSYDTTIPRQAGLSGSSAIVWATLQCLLEFYEIPMDSVDVDYLPSLILSAEEQLGITAGLQDRVIQVYGGVVFMDFERKLMESARKGIYAPLDPSLLPTLYLIYCVNPSDSGKVHSDVKKRWLAGDVQIQTLILEVAQLAVDGRVALQDRDHGRLAEIMDKNFDLRRKIFGDGVLGDVNIKMVETARSVGAACKFTGSGGAVVAFCPKGRVQEKVLLEACQSAGFSVEVCRIGSSNVKAVDGKITLSLQQQN